MHAIKTPRKNERKGFFSRLLRSIFLVVVLSSFVLSISMLVKFLATTTPGEYLALFSKTSGPLLVKINPLLAKLNVKDTKVGQVAGDFAKRFAEKSGNSENVPNSSYGPAVTNEASMDSNKDTTPTYDPNFVAKITVLLLADSHNNFDNLKKALDIGKSRKIATAFFLGDYTDLGVTSDLEQAKLTMDASKIDYFSLPGDHDLWKSVGPANFLEVFGKNYFVTYLGGFKFVGLDNSANYTLIESSVLDKFKKDLADADFVLLSQPLYHPTFQKVMGVVNGEEQPEIKAQAKAILDLIRASNVRAVIAGDQHLSSSNKDPIKTSLSHIVVGALTSERNLQASPRFSILNVAKEGNYQVEEVVLE